MTKEMKTILSKADANMIETFKINYPGWTVVRFADNSLEFLPPIRLSIKKKEPKNILREIN